MKRILALWLPNWPVQRRRAARPELAGRAIVLEGPSRRGQAVAACSAEARAAGVRPGMTVAEALATIQQGSRAAAPHWERHNPRADRRQLARLAQWCCRFSPTTGLEDAGTPETVFLDITNLAPLYGSEAALVRQVAEACRRRGLDARLATADTLGAAWALAHFGPAGKKLPDDSSPGAHRSDPAAAVGRLPLAALRLPEDMQATLEDLGLQSAGDVLALPRDQLRSRFGPLLLQRVDQALGRAGEAWVPVDPPVDFIAEHACEHPMASLAGVRWAIERLLKRLAWSLAARNAGALCVRCQVKCEDRRFVAFAVELFQPTARWEHLLELFELHLERVRLPAPATAIVLRVQRHGLLAERQSNLFETTRSWESSRPLAALVDRLAGRLGSDAVVRYALAEGAQPELAYRAEALAGATGAAFRASRGAASHKAASRTAVQRTASREVAPQRAGGELKCLDRPLKLLPRPAPVAVWAVAPDGPPRRFQQAGERHEVARHWGPERIETGWWRRGGAERDYYRVETTEGRRFWLFRQLRDGRWFLHGAFE